MRDPSIHAGPDFVDNEFPYDTDAFGGPVAGDPDLAGHAELSGWTLPWKWLDPRAQPDHTVELFRARWGVPDMLGPTSMTALEQRARHQGNYYYLTSTCTTSVATPNEDHAVVFLDFRTTTRCRPQTSSFTGSYQASCTTGQSLIIVVRKANVTANGNGVLRASVVIKDGGVTKMNGTFDLFGGLFAEEAIDLSGTGKSRSTAAPSTTRRRLAPPKVDVTNYVEYDRG